MTASQIMFTCAPFIFMGFIATLLLLLAVPVRKSRWLSHELEKIDVQNRTPSKTIF